VQQRQRCCILCGGHLCAGEYTDKGYVSAEKSNVLGLPALVLVVAAIIGTAGYVVAATS
jgi:hypothetical protein